MGPEIFGLLFVPFVIAVIVAVRMIAGTFNHDRIKDYVYRKGGTVTKIEWEPFGPGWFGEKSDAIYKIHYRDRDGNEHRAFCKTSMFTGVYLTEDRILGMKKESPWENTLLEEENRRLKEEIRRLKGE